MMMIIEYLILIDYQIVTMKLIKMMMMMIMEFKTNVLLSAAAFCIPPSVPGYWWPRSLYPAYTPSIPQLYFGYSILHQSTYTSYILHIYFTYTSPIPHLYPIYKSHLYHTYTSHIHLHTLYPSGITPPRILMTTANNWCLYTPTPNPRPTNPALHNKRITMAVHRRPVTTS